MPSRVGTNILYIISCICYAHYTYRIIQIDETILVYQNNILIIIF